MDYGTEIAIPLDMKFTEMLTADPDALRTHYRGVRELAYNNAAMAQGGRPGGRTIRKLANQMGYLMRQVEMCETAARRRGLALVV